MWCVSSTSLFNKMDWAEDIKLSIRKTANRRGRRSKSRDILENTSAASRASFSTAATPTTITNSQPELSIDIMFNLESNGSISTPTATTTATATATSNNMSSGSATSNKNESKLPSFLRRISGGWTEPNFGKTIKSKKGSLEDDRFDIKHPKEILPSHDDAYNLSQYKEHQNDNLLPKKYSENSFSVTVRCKPEEKILSTIADTDLSVLTKHLQTIENVDEADDLWEWQRIFTEVMADINCTNQPFAEHKKKLILKPDELPPTSQLIP